MVIPFGGSANILSEDLLTSHTATYMGKTSAGKCGEKNAKFFRFDFGIAN